MRLSRGRRFIVGVLAASIGLGVCLHPNAARGESDSSRVARLFMWASSSGVRFVDMVQPAKDSIAMMGEAGARWLARKLASTDARERHALADIFAKLGDVATPYVVPCLDSAGEDIPKNAARALGRIGDSAATEPLLTHLVHDKYGVRSEVATALGKIGDPRAAEGLMARLAVELDGDVRKSLTVALGAIGDARAAAILIDALADPFFGVRQTAVRALAQIEPAPIADLIAAIDTLRSLPLYGAIVALGELDDEQARATLTPLLAHADPYVRGFAVEGLSRHPDDGVHERVADLKDIETDPFVLAQIARFESR
ncbi:MAG TPA: HEAT repeat domain-containing protein [Acidobacteriota bacterium]|nr:HEAT repeat domain-containing protein [Acidobacteriota bacterium]